MIFLRVMLSSIWRFLTHDLTSKAFSEIPCGVATQAESMESKICLSTMKYRFHNCIFSVRVCRLRSNPRRRAFGKRSLGTGYAYTFIARPRRREYLLITWYAQCSVKFHFLIWKLSRLDTRPGSPLYFM